MAEEYKVLAQGELPVAAAALYTVPGGTEAIIKNIKLVNQTAGALTVTLWVNGSADSNLWLPSTTEIPANGSAEFEGSLALAATETLQGATAGGANDITYTISGVEIT